MSEGQPIVVHSERRLRVDDSLAGRLQEQVQARWHDPRFALYRRFALFPALSRIDRGGATCIWFTDLRYDLPALPDTFRYGFCRSGETLPWRLYRLRYFSADSRQGLEPAD